MEKIIVYSEPSSPITEAYRKLCFNLLAELSGRKIIEVAAVSSCCNSSNLLANLAVAVAQAGKKVLILDCNMRSPKQQDVFGLSNSGVADVLGSDGNLYDFVQQTEQRNLQVLTSGSPVVNPVEMLMSPAMQQILDTVCIDYDVVLVDVPPIEKVTDAIAMGSKTDGVLLVVTNKTDKVSLVQNAKKMFVQAGVPILGCVLDKAEPAEI